MTPKETEHLLTEKDKAEIMAMVKKIAATLGKSRPIISMNALMIVMNGIQFMESDKCKQPS